MAALGGSFEGMFIVNPRQMKILLESEQGPVYRDLMKRGRRVQKEAKERVGVYKPHPNDPLAGYRKRRPGTLRDSIVVRRLRTEGGSDLVVAVGSEDKIAMIHHEGTIPHQIRARRVPNLVFYSPAFGRVIRKPSVQHPGTKPNRFLTDSLRAINRAG